MVDCISVSPGRRSANAQPVVSELDLLDGTVLVSLDSLLGYPSEAPASMSGSRKSFDLLSALNANLTRLSQNLRIGDSRRHDALYGEIDFIMYDVLTTCFPGTSRGFSVIYCCEIRHDSD
jgi:hypothetical protein